VKVTKSELMGLIIESYKELNEEHEENQLKDFIRETIVEMMEEASEVNEEDSVDEINKTQAVYAGATAGLAGSAVVNGVKAVKGRNKYYKKESDSKS
jgi:hypothetical protein